MASLLRHEGGVSAIEFAMIAPMFMAAIVPMADVGLAAYHRMTMDHVLRAGAQSAMEDPGTERVRTILQITAAENFTLGGSTPEGRKPVLTLATERYCVCPANIRVKLDCSTICPGSVPTLAFYSLSASLTYSGMILPAMVFRPEIQVQVR